MNHKSASEGVSNWKVVVRIEDTSPLTSSVPCIVDVRVHYKIVRLQGAQSHCKTMTGITPNRLVCFNSSPPTEVRSGDKPVKPTKPVKKKPKNFFVE